MALRSVGENCVERGWEDRGGKNHLCGWVPTVSHQALLHLALAIAHTLCLLGAPTSSCKREDNHAVFKLNTVHQRGHSDVHHGVMFIRAGSRKSRCRGMYLAPTI